MKIIELRAENVKRLKAVEIRPSGALVEISGRNGQGKSSVLDAIWWALAGAGTVQRVPSRKGASEALIRLDLGEIKVTRTFKPKAGAEGEITTTLAVENADGARYGSPQKMLDAMLGQLAFDPLAFSRKDARAQFDTLRAFVPGVDFAAIDRANKADFEARTAANRKVRDLTARFKAVQIPEGAPVARVNTDDLVADLENAGAHNSGVELRKARREQAVADVERQQEIAGSYRTNAAELRRQADKEDRKAEEHEASVAALRAKIATAAALPDLIDTSDIRQKISAAQAENDAFDAKARAEAERAQIAQDGKAAEAEAARLTAAIETRNAEKAAAIAAAEMPVAGITFGDGEILLNDIPFEQASDAERLRTSIAIAMAANPKLRVIRVRDGSLLDGDAMRVLGEMAEAGDYQVWIETVGDEGKVGIVLEDGMVRGASLAEAAE